jgi:lipopolysaccharide transport system permease protein
MNSPRHSASPQAAALSLWRNRGLIWQLTKREVIGRYRGSFMGLVWSFVNPILMLVVYTFVFSVVFKARWGESGGTSKTEFAIILFSGLITFNLFAECVNRAPGLILSNVNYVKKVVFPLEIMPWVTMGAALFHALISVAVLLGFFLAFHHFVHWTVLLLPLVWLPFLLLTLGISWFLAATGVFLRDIGQIVGIVTTAMLFRSPSFSSRYARLQFSVLRRIGWDWGPICWVQQW